MDTLKTEAKLAEADAEHELELRTTPLQKGKPLIAKEIESAAWFQNLIYDLGLQTYHALVNGIDWDEEDAKDHKKAVKKLLKRLEVLCRTDASYVERLEQKNKKHREELDALRKRLNQLETQNRELFINLILFDVR